ncbi:hypothetical protein AAOE16_03940 [Ekhidna sp. MALMAid0563]|uniref:hypothetical protein n=1 Tax=Ekhidna sp. MALMAid0563 TaxID=3143937 RepID=UPI0032DE9EEA
MKKSSLILLTLLIISKVFSQPNEWKSLETISDKYKIDGSISVREIVDTTLMKNVVKDRRFIIKKSEGFTYIGIKSNTSSILNAYLIDANKISVLHSSAALGQIDLVREDTTYRATKTEFDWIFRDPESWDEMHPDGVDTIEKFYNRYGWMANTWNSGSYREVEMIIDNAHFTNNTRLIISYTSREDGEYGIRFKEGKNDVSISGDPEVDKQLHNGYIPEMLEFAEGMK